QPRSAHVETDTDHFVRQCEAGADYAITQMFFDPEEYLRLRDRVAARGCDVPIIPEVFPVVRTSFIPRSEKLSGAPFPRDLAARVERFGADAEAVHESGIEHTQTMCERVPPECA